MTTWWPSVIVGGGLLLAYLFVLSRRPDTLPRWSPWRTTAWAVGAVLAGAALTPWLGAHAHHDHRLHMAQHLLLGMYAPIGLVIGAPLTLLLGTLGPSAGRGLVRFLRSAPVHVLSHPVTAALLNVGGMFVLYLTPLLALSGEKPLVHWLVMAHFVAAGCLYTWAIAGPDPAPRRPGMATRVVVLVVAAGAHAWLAKLLYSGAGAHTVQGHGHASTMEQAAMLMYYGGDVAELAVAVMVFSWWDRRRAPRTSGGAVAPRLGRGGLRAAGPHVAVAGNHDTGARRRDGVE